MLGRSSVVVGFLMAMVLVPMGTATALAVGGGTPGNALQFDGQDDIVRVPYAASLGVMNQLTIEVWVRPVTGSGGLAGMWGNGGLADKFLLFLDGGQVRGLLVIDGTPGWTEVTAPIALGQWTHIALTFDGARLSLFLNGVPVDNATGPGTIVEANLPFRVGVEDIFYGVPNRYFTGTIDELRVWSVARSLSDIANSFDRSVPTTSPELVAYWNFDEALTSQEVLDVSPSGNNGTLGANSSISADDPQRVSSTAPVGTPATLAFLRGDCDSSSAVNLSDVIALLGIIFPQSSPPPTPSCYDACDANDSGTVSLPDAIAILGALFGQPAPSLPSPYPLCGVDPTTADTLDCLSAPACLP